MKEKKKSYELILLTKKEKGKEKDSICSPDCYPIVSPCYPSDDTM